MSSVTFEMQWEFHLLINMIIETTVHKNNNNHLTASFPGLPGCAGTRKVKPIWILLKQKTVSGSGISWAVCKSAPCSRQITMPAPHHSVFYRPDALPDAQPTTSKHWRCFDTGTGHITVPIMLTQQICAEPHTLALNTVLPTATAWMQTADINR